MKNMIDRYVYDVTRRLPEAIRNDIGQELRSNIEDMLPESPTDSDIERVLLELGNPSKLAVKYQPKPRYLVSPELFDDYITVLKIVAITLSALLVGITVLTFVFGNVGSVSVSESISSIISEILQAVFTGVAQAFFWVTIIFFLMERLSGKSCMKPWSPHSLPEIPSSSQVVIKPGETIAGAIFSVIFTVIFIVGALRQPPLFAWYESGVAAVPLFNADLIESFLPMFILVLLLYLLAAAAKLIRGRWTYGVAGCHIVHAIVSAAVSMTFISRPDVFTTDFLLKFADKLNITAEALTGGIKTGVTVLIVLAVVGTLVETITVIVRAAKNNK